MGIHNAPHSRLLSVRCGGICYLYMNNVTRPLVRMWCLLPIELPLSYPLYRYNHTNVEPQSEHVTLWWRNQFGVEFVTSTKSLVRQHKLALWALSGRFDNDDGLLQTPSNLVPIWCKTSWPKVGQHLLPAWMVLCNNVACNIVKTFWNLIFGSSDLSRADQKWW